MDGEEGDKIESLLADRRRVELAMVVAAQRHDVVGVDLAVVGVPGAAGDMRPLDVVAPADATAELGLHLGDDVGSVLSCAASHASDDTASLGSIEGRTVMERDELLVRARIAFEAAEQEATELLERNPRDAGLKRLRRDLRSASDRVQAVQLDRQVQAVEERDRAIAR